MGFIGSFFGPTEKTQKVKVEPDEQAQRLNEMRVEQTEGVLGVSDLSDFLSSPNFMTDLSPQTVDLLQDIISESQEEGLNTETFLELAGIGAGSFLDKVVRPRIQNQAALQGRGASGATDEAMATAGAHIALPILSNLPQTDVLLREGQLNRLSRAFTASDTPRQLMASDFMRRQGIVNALVTGMPFNPGQTTTRFENPFDVFLRRDAQVMSNAQSAMSLVGSGMMMGGAR